jgi:hypothetical protein
MSLKAVLSKAEVDALAEPIRKEYTEKDGQFVLAVEGYDDPKEVAELKRKHAEFRDNNKKLFQENEALRPLKERYEGIDPDKYKTMESEIEKLRGKGVKSADDMSAIIQAEIAKATKPIQDKLDAEAKVRADAQQKLIDQEFEKQITDIAVKAGVRQQAVSLIIPKAKAAFEFKDNGIVPRDGVKHPTEPHKDLTPSDWLTELAKSDAYLFAASEGSGAEGNKGRTRSNAKILVNPTAEEMGRNMEAIGKGEILVVRQ